MYRIAWCIKSVGKGMYSYGNWKDESEYNKLKDWCYKQNMIDMNTYYWVEKKEDGKIKNVILKEEFETEFVNIEKR